jgi:peptide-methionine (S)-S-oxide reductase
MNGERVMEKATFGAGCFWHVEEVFCSIPGVISTQVGYAGGTTDNPSYEDVCSQMTGHAEVVEVTFDPSLVSYQELLSHFWSCHDPTQLNRQGPDFGTNYRSVIFYHSDAQRIEAETSLALENFSGRHGRSIVTEIKPLDKFWKAEEYHQKYLARKKGKGC